MNKLFFILINVLVFFIIGVIVCIGVFVWIVYYGIDWVEIGIVIFLFYFMGMLIIVGYYCFWFYKIYDVNIVVRIILVIGGVMVF